MEEPMAHVRDVTQAKLDAGGYPSLALVREDMGQIFVNAKRFNVRESSIFAAAKKLHVRTPLALYHDIPRCLLLPPPSPVKQKILKVQYAIMTGRAPPSAADAFQRKVAKKESATFKGWLQKKLDEIINHSDA
jgi:hypothetical protein